MDSISCLNNSRIYFIFLIFVTLFLSCTPVQASSGGYYAKSVDGFVRYDSQSDFYRTKATFERNPSSNTRAPARITRTVPYSASGLKNLLKLKSLTPGGLALGAALTAADYFWNPDTEEVVTTSTAPFASQPGQCFQGNTNLNIPSFGACLAYGQSLGYPDWIDTGNVRFTHFTNSNTVRFGYWSTNHNNYIDYTTKFIFSGSIPQDTPTNYTGDGDLLGETSEPVSDEEFLEQVAPLIQWGDVAIDDNGDPISTPELQEILNNTNNWYDETYNDNRQTVTTTSTSTTVINQDGTETTTGSEQQEIPAFCNWAGILCDMADWITQDAEPPQHPDMPIEEVDVSTLQSDWTSGLGAGQCPQPIQTNVMGSDVTIETSQYCWAASNVVRPILLFISFLGAGYIMSGLRSKS